MLLRVISESNLYLAILIAFMAIPLAIEAQAATVRCRRYLPDLPTGKELWHLL